ncbi:DUF4307 domain-containing protein [Gulosibacter molinativorax]|uniref:DUF4307 domain-containing protein n=1 Tax=Gulosibacter molinativorax TaxID=256821 RepID=UPI000403F2C0|nr:DUF4307 domain-containing protein [Gulosibacter molinativorax]QUY62144.1 Hypotetical protein [Gulosibacter molinativorax]
MSDLAARYGTSRRQSPKPPSAKTTKWVSIGFVIALTLGTIGFWALTFNNADTTIESQTARFSPISDTEASIQARVSVQPGTPLACAFEAQNDMKAVVGYEVVELPPSAEPHQVVNLTLRTTQRADNVSVRECWIPGA